MSEKIRTYKNCKLRLGVYRLWWKSGGWSFASVGQDREGRYWFAPSNWVSGVPCLDWSNIRKTTLLGDNFKKR